MKIDFLLINSHTNTDRVFVNRVFVLSLWQCISCISYVLLVKHWELEIVRWKSVCQTESKADKLKSCFTTRHGGAWGERRYSSYSFFTSALDGGEWSASRPGRALPPGERTSGAHWTGGWVGPSADVDTKNRRKILLPLPRIEPRSPRRPVCNADKLWIESESI
jgi:hypothetical protein